MKSTKLIKLKQLELPSVSTITGNNMTLQAEDEFNILPSKYEQYQTWRIMATRLPLYNDHRKSVVDDNINQVNLHPFEYHIRNIHGQRKKSYKTILPPDEMLARNEVLGGYIFVCNNETMQEDLHRQLFGLPLKYKDTVRAITPGLPLFLYNYTTHQLHGVYQAVGFGGSNIDPTAWQDKKCRGESRFPAQVRIRTKNKCKPLEEDAFRPFLYHYDGPKFRLQLSVPQALALLDLFNEEDL